MKKKDLRRIIREEIKALISSNSKLINEGYAWERTPGRPLPTLNDTSRAYANNKRLTEANPRLASGLKPLLQVGATINKNAGEDALIKLSDKFDRIDDEYADDIASHLNMAIELIQDRSPSEARAWLNKFNKACKDALSGKSTKSAFEGIRYS
ncbi:MAG: hypothetical protein H8E55_21285, partial [Pelagibacterales bacterium]|nr:hypothetical protein [Pelagibacterales bacterium]